MANCIYSCDGTSLCTKQYFSKSRKSMLDVLYCRKDAIGLEVLGSISEEGFHIVIKHFNQFADCETCILLNLEGNNGR